MDTKPNHNHSHYQRPQGQYTPSNPNHAGETNYPLLSHHYTPTSYGHGNGSGNYGNYGMSYDPLAPSVTQGGGGGGSGQSGMLNGERNGESS